MNFRLATNKDSKAIIELVFTILAEYGLKPDPDKTDSDLCDIELNYNRRNGAFELLEDCNGKIVATVGLFKTNEETVELRKMYLRTTERGKGYGNLLIEHAIETAKKLGYKQIILETASVLKEAIQLYKKYGFQQFESDHLASRCDQAFILTL
jgi:putative acetyltransferase